MKEELETNAPVQRPLPRDAARSSGPAPASPSAVSAANTSACAPSAAEPSGERTQCLHSKRSFVRSSSTFARTHSINLSLSTRMPMESVSSRRGAMGVASAPENFCFIRGCPMLQALRASATTLPPLFMFSQCFAHSAIRRVRFSNRSPRR